MKLKQLGANVTSLTDEAGNVVLFSYETPVACWLILEHRWAVTNARHSRTTSKHLAQHVPPDHRLSVDQSWLDALTVRFHRIDLTR